MQKASVRPSWDVGLKKPRTVLLKTIDKMTNCLQKMWFLRNYNLVSKVLKQFPALKKLPTMKKFINTGPTKELKCQIDEK